MKEALATVEICVLCGWRFLNHFDILPQTPYGCDTVGQLYRSHKVSASCSELCFVPYCALKRTGKYASERKVFILTDFKSDVLMFQS